MLGKVVRYYDEQGTDIPAIVIKVHEAQEAQKPVLDLLTAAGTFLSVTHREAHIYEVEVPRHSLRAGESKTFLDRKRRAGEPFWHE